MNSKIKLDVLTIKYGISEFNQISDFHADIPTFCSTLSESIEITHSWSEIWNWPNIYWWNFSVRFTQWNQIWTGFIFRFLSIPWDFSTAQSEESRRACYPRQQIHHKPGDSRNVLCKSASNTFWQIKFGWFDVLLMSQHSKLNKIRIDWFMQANGNFDLHQIIKLSAMNTSRAKLANANKVTIYVKEDVYLATKRAERDTDLEFIRMDKDM